MLKLVPGGSLSALETRYARARSAPRGATAMGTLSARNDPELTFLLDLLRLLVQGEVEDITEADIICTSS